MSVTHRLMERVRRRHRLLIRSVFLLGLSLASSAYGEGQIALIIDDMGYQDEAGQRALSLPGKITYSFLPHTRFAWQQATQAHNLGRQVMLHLPMESHRHIPPLERGGLSLEMSESDYARVLGEALASVPYVAGINNHMGSLLTRDPTAMRWLMHSLEPTGLFFIDSRTTHLTVAEQVAQHHQIPAGRRDVFLDNNNSEASIRSQFQHLIELAQSNGSAIGIAHPRSTTLKVLEELLPELAAQGIELIPASQLTHTGNELWHASSSPSPTDVKNSKPSPSPIY